MTPCTCPTTREAHGQIVRAYLDALCPVHAQQTGRHCSTCRCAAPDAYDAEEDAAQARPQCEHGSYARIDGRCAGCGNTVEVSESR